MTNVVSIKDRIALKQVNILERLLAAVEHIIDEESDDYRRMEKQLKADELRERIEHKRAMLKEAPHECR